MTPDAFFVRDGDDLVATEHTRGPWNPDHQHAGPPSALLGRTIEQCEPRDDMMVARITLEIVRPVPITRFRCVAQLVRPGRNVQMLEATLSTEDGPVMLARAWRIRTADIGVAVNLDAAPPPPPDSVSDMPFFPRGEALGYDKAMDWRFAKGAFLELGPATVWMRMRIPLVEGEQTSPLCRVLAAADSGNGVSSELDFRRYLFINTDLTVHLHRHPAGEWVRMDARTIVQPHGVGLAESALHDEKGSLGRSLQSLLLAER